MRRLFIIISVVVVAVFAMSSFVSAEVGTSVEVAEKRFADKEIRLLTEKARVEQLRIDKEVRSSVKMARAEMLRAKEEFRASVEKVRAENARTRRELRVSVEKARTESARARKELRASVGERVNVIVKTDRKANVYMDETQASSEHKREIKKEFSVSSPVALSINNEFGNIKILEGAGDKIIFNITVKGKGKNNEEAKKFAESVDVNFNHKGNEISAKTVFGKMQCNNCGRSVDYEVYVPKNVTLTLDNKFGDINVNNIEKPFRVKLQFGKLYANEIVDADINIQHGGATINKCGELKMKSSFSKNKFGEIGTLSGSVSHDGLDIGELAHGDLKSNFSTIDIEKLKKSFQTKGFSHGSLKIAGVDADFSTIKVDASFSKIRVVFPESYNFKTTLYSNFGSIKTGNLVFYEKTLDKKDVVVGVAGKIKEPSATVDISNSHGNIVLQ